MDIELKPGCVHPDEYDWENDFNQLDTRYSYTKMDTGKVLGLAIAYQRLKRRYEELATEIEKQTDTE